MSLSLPTSTSHLQATRDKNRTREPIDYFCKYFGWDTWVEIVNCTNKLSNTTNAVTAKEVAQFVGIHIAMGTLKVLCLIDFLHDYFAHITKCKTIECLLFSCCFSVSQSEALLGGLD